MISLHGIVSRNKFGKRLEIPDYWYEDSIKEGFECPNATTPAIVLASFTFVIKEEKTSR